MNPQFDDTAPSYSRWMQDGTEYVRSTAEWCDRCAEALCALLPTMPPSDAQQLAEEWSLDIYLRGSSPALVAEDLHEDAALLEN